jgi:hypothetical protein
MVKQTLESKFEQVKQIVENEKRKILEKESDMQRFRAEIAELVSLYQMYIESNFPTTGAQTLRTWPGGISQFANNANPKPFNDNEIHEKILTGNCPIGTAFKEVVLNLTLIEKSSDPDLLLHTYYFDYTRETFMSLPKSPDIELEFSTHAMAKIIKSIGYTETNETGVVKKSPSHSTLEVNSDFTFIANPKPKVAILFPKYGDSEVFVDTGLVSTKVGLKQLHKYPEIYKYTSLAMKQLVEEKSITVNSFKDMYKRLKSLLGQLISLTNIYTEETLYNSNYRPVYDFSGCLTDEYLLRMDAGYTIQSDNTVLERNDIKIFFSQKRARILFNSNPKMNVCYDINKDKLIYTPTVSYTHPVDFEITDEVIYITNNESENEFVETELFLLYTIDKFEALVKLYVEQVVNRAAINSDKNDKN